MHHVTLIVSLLGVVAGLRESLPSRYFKSEGHHGRRAANEAHFTEKYFSQMVDHFNFNSMGNGTFNQRYLIAEKYWNRNRGPIFFYTGNEGDIWDFALNSGFITELAEQQGALVLFAEHRYYGKSLPFGPDSFLIPQVGLLTVEQALADYALMISQLKLELGAADCPVIAFGGSYGGMLAAYMRQRYPNLVAGALAASAPVLSTAGMGDSRQFFRDVTADFEGYAPECSAAVRGAFVRMEDLAVHQDYEGLQAAFALCKTPSSPVDVRQLRGMLRNAFTLLAMLDYPYSTHFWGDMPAHPVKVACETMLSGPDLLANLRNTAGIVYNSTGDQRCFDLYSLYVESSNIIYSNGDLDPWANGGVRTSLSLSVVAINITEGAHHLDLRGSNDADPASVITARKTEAKLIAQWVEMARLKMK
ncbi:hypothetical protein CRUP_012408 [Coryphaenoides rupestris]|nr:hypothetical protein CRUP_012408 [Coryphaenoides rupestris]